MSFRMSAVNNLLRVTLKPFLALVPINNTTLAAPRAIIDGLALVIPNDAQSSINCFLINETHCEFVQNKYYMEDKEKCRVILYLHGGAFIAGSPKTHRQITTRLAKYSNARVLVPNYRKTPEHKYPCALKDCVDAYKWLLDQGYSPENIALCGDSAGGNLCISLSRELMKLGLPMPSSQVLYSPWTNLAGDGESHTSNAWVDPYLPSNRIKDAAAMYTSRDKKNPDVSPLYADVTGMQPTLIHCSDNEIVMSDSVEFHKKAVLQGVDCSIEIYENCCHVFQFFCGVFNIPEAIDSIKKTAAYMKHHWRD